MIRPDEILRMGASTRFMKSPKKATGLGKTMKSGGEKSNQFLDDQSVQLAKEAFDVFDVNGDGTISKTELGVVLRTMGTKINQAQAASIVENFDKEGENIFMDDIILSTFST